MKLFQLSIVIGVLGALLVTAGCGDDPTSAPTPPPITWKRPGVGSTFNFSVYNATDSLGLVAPADPLEARTLVDSVIADGATHKGVSNLLTVQDGGSIVYFDYRSNGDIALVSSRGDSASNPWLVLPVGSRGTLTQQPVYDTTTGSSGIAYYYIKMTATYAGTDMVTVGAESIATHRVDVVRTTRIIEGNDTTISMLRNRYWAAPSIGFLARRVVMPYTGSTTSTYTTLILKSYSLK
jgi:hypothetical protein